MMKHKAVVFNLNNPDEKELYDFCMKRASNFSGFVKRVLFAYNQGFPKQEELPTNSDREYMKDLF